MRGVWIIVPLAAAASGCLPDRPTAGDAPDSCDPPASSALGLNAYHLVRAEQGRAGGDVDAAVREARLAGAGAVRMWLFDDERGGGWHAAADRVLDALDEGGLRVVATLSNLWADYGGVPHYLRRAGHDPADLRRFFVDAQAESLWRDDVEAVVRRHRHRRAGLLAWELMNEPRCPRCDPEIVRAWLGRQAAFVRGLDPGRPVWAGDEGWAAGDGWGVDSVGSLHAYPQRESGGTAAEAVAHGRRRIAEAGRRAREAGVPWVLGEIGWRYQGCPADDPDCTRAADGHLQANDVEKAVALGALIDEAWLQGAGRVFVWRLAEPGARDWDHLGITPSMMPRTQVALCEAAHLLGPG